MQCTTTASTKCCPLGWLQENRAAVVAAVYSRSDDHLGSKCLIHILHWLAAWTQGWQYHTLFFFCFFSTHFFFPAFGQAVVTGVVPSPSPPRFLPSIFIAHRVQQSHCSSLFYRVLPTHALALPASRFVHKKSPHEFIRVCTRGDSNSRN